MGRSSSIWWLIVLIGAAIVWKRLEAVASNDTHADLVLAFDQFQRAFHKTYADADEYARRLDRFRHNRERIRAHNADYERGRQSFYLQLNAFADLDDTEYRRRLGYRATAPTASAAGPSARRPSPSSIDWRRHGMVTRVKDQKQCGSCWTFASTGSMEGAYARATGHLLELSEQQLVDCVDDGADDCVRGGEMRRAFAYVIGAGAESEHDYPYTASSGHRCRAADHERKAAFTSFVNITTGEEWSLQQAMATHPAVSVAIDAGSFRFQLYGGGVYDDELCGNRIDDLDHGVLVVGYGRDPAHGDYWIVKNSWGEAWGENGYVRMARNRGNRCGIATDASYIVAKGNGRAVDSTRVCYQ